MKKILGFIYLIASALWCLILIPVSLLAPLGKLYQTLFSGEATVSALTYLIGFVGVLLSCLFAFCILKFGLSILRGSINMIKGKDGKETQKERIRSLVEQKLNKKRMQYNLNQPYKNES